MTSSKTEPKAESTKEEAQKFLVEFIAQHIEFSATMNGPLDDLRRARISATKLVGELEQPAVRKALLVFLQE